MFIHKTNKNNIQFNNLLNKKTSNFEEYKVEDFFNNLITPHHFNDIIGIYIVFNKDIKKENENLIKDLFEERLDYGFTNVLHLSSTSCLLVRFDLDYDMLCHDIENITINLEKNDLSLKCSIIYGDQSTYYIDLYNDLKTYYLSIKNKNAILISNYYEYMFKKNNP